MVFLLLASALATSLAWRLAFKVTGSAAAAWFGWAAVTTAAPFVLETYTVYPDGLGAIAVLTGFWALLRAPDERPALPWFLHGLALALLPWMHTRFAVLAATLGGLILVRLAKSERVLTKAIAFLAAPALSAVAWMFFFAVVYGTPDPSAPYGGQVQNAFAFLPNGLGGLLFDQGFGLFATAPVLLVAIAGFVWIRRLAVDWVVVAVPYLLAVATFAMWWAGQSGPARFLLPLLLPLAIPAACAWRAAAASPGWRTVMLTALAASVWLTHRHGRGRRRPAWLSLAERGRGHRRALARMGDAGRESASAGPGVRAAADSGRSDRCADECGAVGLRGDAGVAGGNRWMRHPGGAMD